MSRVGKVPIPIPQGTEVKLNGSALEVKGPKGTLFHTIPEGITVSLHVDRPVFDLQVDGFSTFPF